LLLREWSITFSWPMRLFVYFCKWSKEDKQYYTMTLWELESNISSEEGKFPILMTCPSEHVPFITCSHQILQNMFWALTLCWSFIISSSMSSEYCRMEKVIVIMFRIQIRLSGPTQQNSNLELTCSPFSH